MILLRILLLLMIGSGIVRAQALPAPPDSASTDTVVVRFLSGMVDAIPGRVLPGMTDSVWHWSDVRTLPDILSLLSGSFAREIGEDGRPLYGWYLGGSRSYDGVAIDGISRADIMFGTHDLSLFPVEFLAGVEKLRGPAALLAGSRWNLRTRQYASPEPRTAIRYVQSPDETIMSDGSYSQNIARSTNLHVGFQRRASDGRFQNSGLSSWALRARLRYNAAPWLNLMGTWSYDKTSFGSNGGIDRTRTAILFDDVTAVVFEPDAYDLRTRTNTSFHALADIFGDSLSLTRLIIAQADQEREFHRARSTPAAIETQDFAITTSTQVRLEQGMSVPFLFVRAMIQSDMDRSTDSTVLQAVERSTVSGGFSAEIRLVPWIRPSLGVRFDEGPEGGRTSYALDLELDLPADLTLFGAYEQRALFPDLRHAAWIDSLVRFSSQLLVGEDRLLLAGIRWAPFDGARFVIEGFRREHSNTSLFFQDTSASGEKFLRQAYVQTDETGATFSGHLRIGPFFLDGWLTGLRFTSDTQQEMSMPRLWARWEIGWQDRLFGDELGLKLAMRGVFFDRYSGATYDPRSGLFASGSPISIGRMTRLDGYIAMDIGNALVMLSWKNIVGTNFLMLDTYPMPDRQFTLGVRWRFFD